MAKTQARARFVTEVAPSQVVSIIRRRKVPRSLDTIAEDEREHQLAYGPDHHPNHHQQTANSSAAWTTKRAPLPQERERTGGSMRELSKYFSDSNGHQGGSWDQSSRQAGYRRAVHA